MLRTQNKDNILYKVLCLEQMFLMTDNMSNTFLSNSFSCTICLSVARSHSHTIETDKVPLSFHSSVDWPKVSFWKSFSAVSWEGEIVWGELHRLALWLDWVMCVCQLACWEIVEAYRPTSEFSEGCPKHPCPKMPPVAYSYSSGHPCSQCLPNPIPCHLGPKE